MNMNISKNKKNLAIIALIAMLGLSVGYTAIDKYNQDIEQKQNELIQEAVQEAVMYGYEQAVVDLVNLVATCQPIPISIENTTIEIVAVECLKGV